MKTGKALRGTRFTLAVLIFLEALASPAFGSGQSRGLFDSEELNLIHYDYLPGTYVLLGQGFAIDSPTSPTPPCIRDFQAIPSSGTAISQGTTFHEEIASSTQGLKKVLGIDERMDASVLTYSAGGEFDFNEDSDLLTNDLYVVVTGTAAFGNEVIDLSRLRYTPTAQALIDAGKIEEFRRFCGASLVSEVNHGIYLSVVISIHDLSESDREKMGLDVSGSGGIGPLTASARVNLDQAITDRHSSIKSSVDVYIRGGGGVKDLAPLLENLRKEGQTVSDIQAGIGSLLDSLGSDKAAVTGFTTMPYPGLASGPQELFSNLKTEKLSDLVEVYRFQNARYLSLKSDLLLYQETGRMPRHLEWLSPVILGDAIADLPAIEGFLQTIALVHRDCMQDQSIELGSCKIPAKPPMAGFDLLYDMVRDLNR